MAVAVVSGTSLSFSAGDSPRGGTINIGSVGTKGLLLVWIFSDEGARSVTGLNYNSSAMTLVDSQGTTGLLLKLYAIWGALSSSASLDIALDGYSNGPRVSWASFSGVDQTTPYGAAVKAAGSSTTPSSGSITLPSSGLVVAGFNHGYSTSTPSVTSPSATLGTALLGNEGGNQRAFGAASRGSTGAVAWTCPASNTWNVIGVPINADGAGGGSIAPLGGKQMTGGFFDMTGGTN